MQRSTAQPIDVDSQRTRTAFEESDLVSRSVRSVPCEHQENTAAPQQRHPQSGTTTQVTTVSTDQLCLTNARLVLRGEVISGSIQIADGKITAVDSGTSTVGEDLQQDYLLPGLVELHTDHIESHFAPRPGVRWNTLSAIQAHDAQIAASGITTVFDCLRVGRDEDDLFIPGEMVKLYAALVERRVKHSETYSQVHREAIAAACKARNITLASHDDANVDHIHEALHFGVSIAEFPTTGAAATEAKKHGMKTLMGAPNVVRGQSHSGNLAAKDLAFSNELDLLSSDYVPSSLLHAPFVLSMQEEAMSLADAVSLVTSNPAETVGLNDRGEIREGLNADLIRVSYQDDVPFVRSVWRRGLRVA